MGGVLAPVPALIGLGGSIVLAGLWGRPEATLLVLIAIGALSGAIAEERVGSTLSAPLPQGVGTMSGVAAGDATPYGTRSRFVVRPTSWKPAEGRGGSWNGPRIAVVFDGPEVVAGDSVVVSGLLRSSPGLVRGDPVAGRLSASTIEVLAPARSPLVMAGNLLRARVKTRLAALGDSPRSALLAGFLIGDVAGLPRADVAALRRSGLTHFVAVSGSNVALVLGAWWLVIGPLGANNRIRAASGMVVLVIFVVATRWESSVIRAATMAALVLGGRLAGVPLDAWSALGAAVAILLGVSGDLAYDVGFQLSVFATAGVILGTGVWTDRFPRVAWGALAATVGAQAAVMPLLLLHFGTVPLLAPLANLIAAPLVTLATALAGSGVVAGWDPVLRAAEMVSGAVLAVARLAGEWPQLGPAAVCGLGLSIAAVWKTRLRPVVIAAVVLGGALAVFPARPPAVPTLTFLDVGQGDAILVRDPSGANVLVDGGRDPVALRRAVGRYDIGRIDLVVATHGDADHVGGLVGFAPAVTVGRLWVPAFQKGSELLDEVVAGMKRLGIPVDEVDEGHDARLGELALRVLGPARRFAAENDGSVVLWIEVGETTVLLPGDIGVQAQGELPRLAPDVMLVPHHGAASSDLSWLAVTVGGLAVISVGPNTYGHPAPAVLQVLREAGATVVTTAEVGDISVRLR